ncbi:unnamed protein product [Orchesella dallaii]|uniref:THAP-type domain-containing protein n=1 Tax=Orchesella dallaii TaxID=48710 RepID=A0ABP1S5T3_9HEXA
MSGTVCCYSGCKRSYSADKDVSFFVFPADPKRRKKWMDNCGNTELKDMDERQLRRKRICSDHFISKAFSRPESRTALNDSAVPIPAKIPAKPRTTKESTPVPSSKASTSITESVSTPKKPPPKLQKRNSKPDPPTPKASETDNKKDVSGNLESKKIEELPTPEPEKIPTPASTPKGSESPKKTTRAQKNAAKLDPVTPKASEVEGKKSTIGEKEQKKSEVPETVTEQQKAPTPISSPKVTETPKKSPVKSPKKNSKPDPPTQKPSEAEGEKETSGKADLKKSEELIASPAEPKKITPVSTPKGGETPKKPLTKKQKKILKQGVAKPKPPETEAKQDSSENPKPAKKPKLDDTVPVTDEAQKAIPASSAPSGEVLKKKVTKLKKIKKSGPPKAAVLSILENKKLEKKTIGNVDPAVKALVPEAQTKATLELAKSSSESPKVVKKIAKLDGSGSEVPKLIKKVKVVKSDKSGTGAPKLVKKVKVIKSDGSSSDAPKLMKKVAKSVVSSSDTQKVIKKVSKSDGSSSSSPKLIKKVVKSDGSGSEMQKLVKKVVKSEGSRPKLPFYPDACTELASLDSQKGPDENLFEGFYVSLKRFLKLSGRWTIGGVQWDPQGKRKVIMVSEPEISPNGRPCVKRCLQFFEDKALKVFIDGLDMTDVFEMTSYADKEDVAALICRVAEASSCCGVPEMICDDLPYFPTAKKRSTSYFDSECPGIIPTDSYDAICSACTKLRTRVLESRQEEKKRLNERRIRSQEKQFQHPFGEAVYSMFSDLVDETDPSKPKKKRTKETFFRKFLTDTRFKMNGDSGRNERIYVEKPISVDSVSASFQDIVSKLGFSMPNAQKLSKPSLPGSTGARPLTSSLPTPRPRIMPGTSSGMVKVERKHPIHMEHILPFTPGSSFSFEDGQEYELIGEVDAGSTEVVEVKPNPNQYEIIEVDDETLAKLASSKNQVVLLPEVTSSPSNMQVTRIDANDPNLSQILKAINTSHGFKVT